MAKRVVSSRQSEKSTKKAGSKSIGTRKRGGKDRHSHKGRSTSREGGNPVNLEQVILGDIKEIKSSRVEVRFTTQQQEMMEKASSILGYKNTTEYIRYTMQENASKVLKEQSILTVAEQDRQRIIDEINNSAEPSESFRSAAEFYRNSFKR